VNESNFKTLIDRFNKTISEHAGKITVSDIMDVFGVPYSFDRGAIRIGGDVCDPDLEVLCEQMGLYHEQIGASGKSIPRFKNYFQTTSRSNGEPISWCVTNSRRKGFSPADFVLLGMVYSDSKGVFEKRYTKWNLSSPSRSSERNIDILEGCNLVLEKCIPMAKEGGHLLVIDEVGDFQKKFNEAIASLGDRATHNGVVSGKVFKQAVSEYLQEDFCTPDSDLSIVILRKTKSGDFYPLLVDFDGKTIDPSQNGLRAFVYKGNGRFGPAPVLKVSSREYKEVTIAVTKVLSANKNSRIYKDPDSVIAGITSAVGFDNVSPRYLESVISSIPGCSREKVFNELSRLKIRCPVAESNVEPMPTPSPEDDRIIAIILSAINCYSQVLRALVTSSNLDHFPQDLVETIRADYASLNKDQRSEVFSYIADSDLAIRERFPIDYSMIGNKSRQIALSGTAMSGIPPVLLRSAFDYVATLFEKNNISLLSAVNTGMITVGSLSALDISAVTVEERKEADKIVKMPSKGTFVRFVADVGRALRSADPALADKFANEVFSKIKRPVSDFFANATVYGDEAKELTNGSATEVSIRKFSPSCIPIYNLNNYSEITLSKLNDIVLMPLLMVGVYIGSRPTARISYRDKDKKYKPIIDYKLMTELVSLSQTYLLKAGVDLSSVNIVPPRVSLAREFSRGFIVPLTTAYVSDTGDLVYSFTGIQARKLREDGYDTPKYKRIGKGHLPGVTEDFLASVLEHDGEFSVVEGEVDAYWMHAKAGLRNTLACGTAYLRKSVIVRLRQVFEKYCEERGVEPPALKPTLYIEDAAGRVGAEGSVKNILAQPGYGYIKVVYFNEVGCTEKLDANDILKRPDGVELLRKRQEAPDRAFVMKVLDELANFNDGPRGNRAAKISLPDMISAVYSIVRTLSPSDSGILPETVEALRAHPQFNYWVKKKGFDIDEVLRPISILTPGINTYPPRSFGGKGVRRGATSPRDPDSLHK